MAKRTYIADAAPNQLIEGVFAIQNCQLGQTKNGKPYLKCLIGDKSGRAPGRMWNASEQIVSALPTDGFVYLEGQTQPYQGEMQVIIQTIAPAQPSDADLQELLPSTAYDIDAMFDEVRGILGGLSSPSMQRLAQAYLGDAALMQRFKQAPAAMQLHHAFIGGLLEHTLALLRLGEAVLPLYPRVNRDLVLMGLFIHDLGKCAELTWETGFGYSDDGQLVGHIARGLVWLNDKARALDEAGEGVPAEALRVLEHIIVSHHGVPEFGAVKIPATPEAILVHLLDNVDAKMQMSLDATRSEKAGGAELGGNFTEKMWALGTRLYRPDPLAEEAAAPAGKKADGSAKPQAADAKPKAAGKTAHKQLTLGGDPEHRGGL